MFWFSKLEIQIEVSVKSKKSKIKGGKGRKLLCKCLNIGFERKQI